MMDGRPSFQVHCCWDGRFFILLNSIFNISRYVYVVL